MKSNKHCPCVDCVCIAICRLKRYIRLINDCRLITDYMKWDRISQLRGFRVSIMVAIDPIPWKVDHHGAFLVY